jgi:hypothetical protein
MPMALMFLHKYSAWDFLVTSIGVLLYCSPVEANLETHLVLEGKARCGTLKAYLGMYLCSCHDRLDR